MQGQSQRGEIEEGTAESQLVVEDLVEMAKAEEESVSPSPQQMYWDTSSLNLFVNIVKELDLVQHGGKQLERQNKKLEKRQRDAAEEV